MTPRALGIAIAIAASIDSAGVAWGETTIEAFGSSTVGASDEVTARTRALDDAFRQAVDQTVVSLVDPAARDAHADVIKKRVLRRSRVYVLKYKLHEASQDEGIYHVRIEATVAVDQIASDLRSLGVPLIADPAPQPRPDPDREPAPPRAATARPRVLVVVVAADDGGRVRATFGKGDPEAEPGPAATAVERAFAARGFEVLTARGLEVPVRASGEPREGLPLTDEQTLALAHQVGAGVAVVAGVRSRATGRIRGARLVGAEGDGTIRLLDFTQPQVIALHDGRAAHAGFGADAPAAADAALGSVAAELADRASLRLRARWPDRANVAGGVAVRVRGAERWPDVAELAKAAAAIPGVKQVTPIRFARGEVVLAVLGGASARSVSDALAVAQIAGVQVSARLVDEREVAVQLQGSGRPAIPEAK